MGGAAIDPKRFNNFSPSIIVKRWNASRLGEQESSLPLGLSASFPPTLLLHGTNDCVVPASSSKEFERALLSQGVTTISTSYIFGGQHIDPVFEMMQSCPVQIHSSPTGKAIRSYWKLFLSSPAAAARPRLANAVAAAAAVGSDGDDVVEPEASILVPFGISAILYLISSALLPHL